LVLGDLCADVFGLAATGLIRWVSPEVAEVGMARRRIGQEDLIARPEPRAGATLTELAAR
jgi:hypothetical protein